MFRRLQREGTPFAAGVLWENDLDYPVACALAAEVHSLPAFAELTDETLDQARARMDGCETVLCTLPEKAMTGLAAPLLSLVEYARALGKLVEAYGL